MAMRVAMMVLWAGALTACVGAPQTWRMQQQQRAAYNAAAGAPVRSFSFSNSIWSWEPLGENQLVIYTTPRIAYLLDVPSCSPLVWTQSMGLTSTFREVSANFDKVLVGKPRVSCVITQIRPVDLSRLKTGQEPQREVDLRPRDGQDG